MKRNWDLSPSHNPKTFPFPLGLGKTGTKEGQVSGIIGARLQKERKLELQENEWKENKRINSIILDVYK